MPDQQPLPEARRDERGHRAIPELLAARTKSHERDQRNQQQKPERLGEG